MGQLAAALPQHGTVLAWARGCRCDQCEREYQRFVSELPASSRFIGSHGFEFDEQYVQDVAGRSWDRGYDPDGYRRQLAASASQPNRTAALRRITVPSLVIHGLDDPLVAPSGGLAVAKAIPGSRFVGFSGMGHDLPRELWPEFVLQIAALAAPAGQRQASDHQQASQA